MIEDHNPFKLTPEENNAYFERELRPELAAGSKAVEQPIFILVGGQPGAGKSRVTAGAKNSLENNTIVLDADLFLTAKSFSKLVLERRPLPHFRKHPLPLYRRLG